MNPEQIAAERFSPLLRCQRHHPRTQGSRMVFWDPNFPESLRERPNVGDILHCGVVLAARVARVAFSDHFAVVSDFTGELRIAEQVPSTKGNCPYAALSCSVWAATLGAVASGQCILFWK